MRHIVAATRGRENQRYHLDLLLAHLRQLAVESGRRLAAAGVLGDAADVFLLEAPEFRALTLRPTPRPGLAALLDRRRSDHSVWRARLPATFLFDGVETEGELAVSGTEAVGDAATTLVGTGASSGRARGPVRVVRELSGLAEVRPGEVLVTPTTDPGWSSVFPLLSGLVTETGGMLSHGALLAREYGLPAVLAVPGATAVLRTGEEVEVDGSRGRVRRVEAGGA